MSTDFQCHKLAISTCHSSFCSSHNLVYTVWTLHKLQNSTSAQFLHIISDQSSQTPTPNRSRVSCSFAEHLLSRCAAWLRAGDLVQVRRGLLRGSRGRHPLAPRCMLLFDLHLVCNLLSSSCFRHILLDWLTLSSDWSTSPVPGSSQPVGTRGGESFEIAGALRWPACIMLYCLVITVFISSRQQVLPEANANATVCRSCCSRALSAWSACSVATTTVRSSACALPLSSCPPPFWSPPPLLCSVSSAVSSPLLLSSCLVVSPLCLARVCFARGFAELELCCARVYISSLYSHSYISSDVTCYSRLRRLSAIWKTCGSARLCKYESATQASCSLLVVLCWLLLTRLAPLKSSLKRVQLAWLLACAAF